MAPRAPRPARPQDARIVLARPNTMVNILPADAKHEYVTIKVDTLRHCPITLVLTAFRGDDIVAQFMAPLGWWLA
jgi:hypothetical protein